MRHFCTFFDSGYLVRGIALYESLAAHADEPFTLHVVCLDELSRLVLARLSLPGVRTIPLHRVEKRDRALYRAWRERSRTEYCWTLTPSVVSYVMETTFDADRLTYLDADLFFFSSPAPLFEEFSEGSILIHEHRFQESFQPAQVYGRFNVGLVSFRRDPVGLEALSWWRERCNEWCFARLEEGRFGDQKYLDDWPERFPGVVILRHPGGGVAPWNLLRFPVSRREDGVVTVEGEPLVFFHFHGLTIADPRYVILSRIAAHRFPMEVVRVCYLPYVRGLERAMELVMSIVPTFSCGLRSPFLRGHAAILRHPGSVAFSPSERVELRELDPEHALLMTPQVILP